MQKKALSGIKAHPILFYTAILLVLVVLLQCLYVNLYSGNPSSVVNSYKTMPDMSNNIYNRIPYDVIKAAYSRSYSESEVYFMLFDKWDDLDMATQSAVSLYTWVTYYSMSDSKRNGGVPICSLYSIYKTSDSILIANSSDTYNYVLMPKHLYDDIIAGIYDYLDVVKPEPLDWLTFVTVKGSDGLKRYMLDIAPNLVKMTYIAGTSIYMDGNGSISIAIMSPEKPVAGDYYIIDLNDSDGEGVWLYTNDKSLLVSIRGK